MTDPEQGPGRDPVVARANDLTFTFLDALGTLLFAAGVGWWAWTAGSPAHGLVAAAVVVTGLSMAGQARSHPKPPKAKARQRAHVPGPTDPGPVHIAGGQ